jgi:RHS repeat-associated protein
VALTDATGKLAAYYEYDAWGNTMTEAEKTGVDNPYRYSTKEWDEKSGLYYFGARYYSPEIGRWTQRDPAGTVDGLNVYTYVGNASSNMIDPDGRYHSPAHFDLTRVLALHAGYSVDLARQIAACDNSVDVFWPAERTVPTPFVEPDRTYSTRWHFPSPERLQTLRARVFASCDPCAFGRYLHALQDSYEHQGYTARWGHAWMTVDDMIVDYDDRLAPDYMANDPSSAYLMAHQTYKELDSFADKCCEKLGDGLVGAAEKMTNFRLEIWSAIYRDRPR